MRIPMYRFLSLVLILFLCLPLLTGCQSSDDASETSYYVYLSLDYDALPKDVKSDVLIIDASNYTSEQIKTLHEKNKTIYSYFNIGSIETFRDNYETFAPYTLGAYPNWTDEYFMDVSEERWQSYLTDTLAPNLLEKGIDGFFVDNADVYDAYPTDAVYDGLVTILTSLRKTGASILLNGGDVFVSKYLADGNSLSDIADGVNQESVFTQVDFDSGTTSAADEDTTDYYLSYLAEVFSCGGDVYIIEYTTDPALKQYAIAQCKELGYVLYVSNSINLGL